MNAADAKFMNAVDLTGNTLFTGGDVLFAGSLNSLTAGAFGASSRAWAASGR